VHREGGGRAQAAHSRALPRAGRARARARGRRRLDWHDPRLLLAAPAGAPTGGRDRPGVPRARPAGYRARGARRVRAGARGLPRVGRARGRGGAARAARQLPAAETREPRARRAQRDTAYPRACVAVRTTRDASLLRELLTLYNERFAAMKDERSGLDFEDLQLLARDLLDGDPALRERYRERFEHVMVDEF